jgi:hypothetical protein
VKPRYRESEIAMPSAKPTILIQLDTDPQPSVFDAVVAVDAGADQLFRHGGVEPGNVKDLVYGALFTRGPEDLARTAIFLGGSDVSKGEALLAAVKGIFFGPFRVSVLLDANGANTTAAAAVLAAAEGAGGSLRGVHAAVLGGTGPVGQRVARLLAREGAHVALGSRSLERATAVAESIGHTLRVPIRPFATATVEALKQGLSGATLVVAAGAGGAQLLPLAVRTELPDLRVAIDLNAIPPLGLEGVEANDRGADRQGIRAWGALGVGRTKMKIHKKAVQELFTANDRVLDAEEILALGRSLG